MEAMARSGIGRIDLVDNDFVSLSNINRQIIATDLTVGKSKVEVMAERIRSINPDCEVHCFPCFYLPENKDEFCLSDYNYVIDAVDTVTAKLGLIMEAHRLGVPVISAMGAGNKLDPTAFKVSDNQSLPFGKSYAKRVQETRHRVFESGLFRGRAYSSSEQRGREEENRLFFPP